jgi:hypothetical protein
LLFNPRYGVVGLLAVPYYLVFEALAPVIELSGYVVGIAALAFGWLDWRFAELMFLTAVVYGTLISVLAIILEEVSFRRYPRVTDLLRLSLYGALENFGYRQLTLWWRLRGTVDFLRGRAEWGAMARQGFTKPAAAPATPTND